MRLHKLGVLEPFIDYFLDNALINFRNTRPIIEVDFDGTVVLPKAKYDSITSQIIGYTDFFRKYDIASGADAKTLAEKCVYANEVVIILARIPYPDSRGILHKPVPIGMYPIGTGCYKRNDVNLMLTEVIQTLLQRASEAIQIVPSSIIVQCDAYSSQVSWIEAVSDPQRCAAELIHDMKFRDYSFATPLLLSDNVKLYGALDIPHYNKRGWRLLRSSPRIFGDFLVTHTMWEDARSLHKLGPLTDSVLRKADVMDPEVMKIFFCQRVRNQLAEVPYSLGAIVYSFMFDSILEITLNDVMPIDEKIKLCAAIKHCFLSIEHHARIVAPTGQINSDLRFPATITRHACMILDNFLSITIHCASNKIPFHCSLIFETTSEHFFRNLRQLDKEFSIGKLFSRLHKHVIIEQYENDINPGKKRRLEEKYITMTPTEILDTYSSGFEFGRNLLELL